MSQDCPGGIGNEVTTKSECREAAQYFRFPLAYEWAGHHGPKISVGFRGFPRNCFVNADPTAGTKNPVWFNYDQDIAPSRGCPHGVPCKAVCKIG